MGSFSINFVASRVLKTHNGGTDNYPRLFLSELKFVGGMIRPSVEGSRRHAEISIRFGSGCRVEEEFPEQLQKQAAVPVFSVDLSSCWLAPPLKLQPLLQFV